ncbi:MAG: TadE/TadG family type IV pilus assembly protein [Paracoccaceae bacterium]
MKRISGALRDFGRNEDGNGTIEFVLVLPGFMLLFTSAYEAGMLSTRHVMLERGLDSAVRDVRIGRIPQPDHEILTQRICDYASIIPNCMTNIRLEMIQRNPRAWVDPNDEVACVDREEEGDPVLNFTNGGNNELMILRACVLFEPMIPTSGLGKAIPKESGSAYALVATSSYVMEPFQR